MKYSMKRKIFKQMPIFLIGLAFIAFIIITYKTYEGFNSDYPQKKYSPSTDKPIPNALDGTRYISPDSNGDCPSGFERDQSKSESLCHAPCEKGSFYNVDNKIYGCVLLNKKYPQEKYSTETYPYAEDKKTNIVSPSIDGRCPKFFELDIKTGLCHTKCNKEEMFYGNIGCLKINTNYSQTNYDGSRNPYPIAEDSKTKYVSPTSSALCPKKFSLDYISGLCYTDCPAATKFNGTKSGSSIIGCQ